MLRWILRILPNNTPEVFTELTDAHLNESKEYEISMYLPISSYSLPVQYSFYTIEPRQSLLITTPSHRLLLKLEKPKYPLREGWYFVIHYLSIDGNFSIASRAPPFMLHIN